MKEVNYSNKDSQTISQHVCYPFPEIDKSEFIAIVCNF